VELRTYRHAWGAVGPGGRYATFSEFLPAVAALGYHGIELAPVVFEAMPGAYGKEGPNRLRELLTELGLELVPMVMTFGETTDQHATQFARQLELAMSWNPSLVVSHTGSDSFDEAESQWLLEQCVTLADQLDVRVAHETHRGRALSTPWCTARFLERVPALWLKADFSHFVCSAERLLSDAGEVMSALCQRVVHVDLRVGYENGPQVPDPWHARWRGHRVAFEAWWDQIWRAAEDRGDPWVSVTPEYGPPTYAPDGTSPEWLWDLCESVARAARERFAAGAWRVVPSEV